MKPFDYYKAAFQKYATFSGRARRSEYWYFALFNFIFAIVAIVIDNVTGLASPELGYGVFYGLYALAVLIPGLAVFVRRLHDVGKSGWMILVGLIPLVGAIWLFVLTVTEGEPGTNQYGLNPKNPELDDVMNHLVE